MKRNKVRKEVNNYPCDAFSVADFCTLICLCDNLDSFLTFSFEEKKKRILNMDFASSINLDYLLKLLH